MNDAELLKTYVATSSADAFAQLVQRHINLVYSLALRNTRDAHMAEDVTQAVFLVLAKRAGTIRDPALLLAWLMSTTRYTASNARRTESRRRHHEQKAAAMHSESYTASSPELDIAPLLDHGLCALKPADRTAVILRYLHGKTAREIGEDLSISEQSAQKRITRALEKIRTFLMRRGISCPADAIMLSLGEGYLQAAPTALISLIVRGSLDTAATTTSVSVLADATIKTIAWMHAKLLAAAWATCLVIAAGTAVVVMKPPMRMARAAGPAVPIAAATTEARAVSPPAAIFAHAASSQPASSEVLLLPNDSFAERDNPHDYTADIDAATSRSGGPPALLLQSDTAQPKAPGGASRRVDIEPFLGKRVRLSAYVKSSALANWGGLFFKTSDDAGRTYAMDDMMGRGISHVTDWTRLEIVADIAPQATAIVVGLHLHGSGGLWLDGARLEVVGQNVPTTDDHNMHLYTALASNYSAVLDPAVQRNGHAVLCISSASTPTRSWCWYGLNNRVPEPYLGRRIRISAWIKSQNVTGSARLSVWAWTPEGKLICIDNPATRRLIKGTADWKKYETTADVPPVLDNLDPGVNLFGNGKIWIDDYQVELVTDTDSNL